MRDKSFGKIVNSLLKEDLPKELIEDMETIKPKESMTAMEAIANAQVLKAIKGDKAAFSAIEVFLEKPEKDTKLKIVIEDA